MTAALVAEVVQPAGRAGAVTPSKFSVRTLALHPIGTGVAVGVGDGLGVGLTVGDGLVVGEGLAVGDGLGVGDAVGLGDGVGVQSGHGVGVGPQVPLPFGHDVLYVHVIFKPAERAAVLQEKLLKSLGPVPVPFCRPTVAEVPGPPAPLRVP